MSIRVSSLAQSLRKGVIDPATLGRGGGPVTQLRLVPKKTNPKPVERGRGRTHFTRLPRPAVRTLAVISGKGGVGKSNLVANLAVAMGKLGASVVIVDADFGQANQDLLLGVNPRLDLLNVLRGECGLENIVMEGPAGVRLVPAGSGDARLNNIDDVRREGLFREVGALAAEADVVLIDTASGASNDVTGFALAASELIVVTTAEPTAYADSYGLLKVLAGRGLSTEPGLLVNLVSSIEDAEETAHQLASVTRRFLGKRLHSLGHLPYDPAVPQAVQKQEPVVLANPASPFSRTVMKLAERLLERAPDGTPTVAPNWDPECA
jgi:flagellar biosynthesis protein FlhG